MKTKSYIKYLSLLLGMVWISNLPGQDGWEQMTKMPQSASWYGSCMDPAGDKVYIFGGSGPSQSLFLLDNTQIYDFVTDTWSSGADMLQTSSALSAEMVNGKIYLLGENVNPHALCTVKVYDPGNDTWTEEGICPQIFYAQGSCVYNGLIYSFGGRDVNFNLIKTVRSYDPSTDTWDQLEDMPYARDKSAVCIYEDEVYLFGGDPSLKYTPSTDSWTELDAGPCEIVAHATPIVHGDKILLFGGYKSGGNYPNPCNEIWVYNPVQENMVKLDIEMPFKRFTRGHLYNNYVYLFGGHYNNTLQSVTDEVWRFDLSLVSINENKFVSRKDFILYPNQPNPFSNSTSIEYRLNVPTTVTITIYNHLGEQVGTIYRTRSQGVHQEVWNATGLPAGIYYCVLRTERVMRTVKLIKR
jgi:N-acetylneuraminic acid mutarotase